MKAIKRIMSMLLVLTMTMGLAVAAFAAEPELQPLSVEQNGVITVSGPQLTNKDVTIVRMFKENIGSGNTTVGYTLESAWQTFFNKKLNKSEGTNATSQEAYEYVAKLLSEQTGTKGTTLIEFAKEAKAAYKANTTAFSTLVMTQTAVDNNSVTFNNVTSGYYLVLPATGSTGVDRVTDAILVNVSNSHPANVKLKTEYPTVDKTVTPEGGQGNSAQIGDKLTFKLQSKVPNMADYKTYFFAFKDTMSKGLTLDVGSIKVSVGGQEVTKDTDYTVATNTVETDKTQLTITFADLKKVNGATAGAQIVVEYTATLNEKAEIGQNPNTNKVEVEYSNDPSSESHGTSEPDITYSYTFDIKVHKYGNDNKETLLPGAVFQLQTSDGTPIKLVKESETVYRVATAADQSSVDTFLTVATADIQIKGLKAGKYQLKEITAPEGYNPLAKPVEFEIQAGYEEDGKLSAGYPKYVVGAAQATESNVIEIQNRNGTYLPETGSIGTIGLTLAGVALVIGGVGFTSRKKKEQE